MTLISDGLLIGAALVAALYCHVLAGRLRRLGDLDAGLGGAVAALSRQAEELRRAMDAARRAGEEQTRELARRTARAEAAAGRLEILIAAMHDAEARLPRPLVRPSRVVDEDEDDEAPRAPAFAEADEAAQDERQDAAAQAAEAGRAPAAGSRNEALAAAIRALARGETP